MIKNIIQALFNAFNAFFNKNTAEISQKDPLNTVLPIPQQPTQAPTPVQQPAPVVPEPPKYDWGTVAGARHAVRVICDEMGLIFEQKDTLCATMGGESGWQTYYLSGPKKGQVVKLQNKDPKTGAVWSTDWGIAQINDHYHIGPGKDFISVEFVLANPEAVIRWVCKMWLAGRRTMWVAYTSGRYKQFMVAPVPVPGSTGWPMSRAEEHKGVLMREIPPDLFAYGTK